MKIVQIIICIGILSKCDSAKSADEGRPYEFGFTIDGQQHRYEKKDVNGIIQGEFGFITGDGIYHVTTYATDANGSFRILSTRNVRISDPLDGSGGTYSNKVPASAVQSAGSLSKPQANVIATSDKQQQQQQKPPPTTHITPPNKIDHITSPEITPPNKIGHITPSEVTPPNKIDHITQTTTRRPFTFTTQPTIKPACAGCGYVTHAPTTKKPIIPVTQTSLTDKPYQNQILQDFSSQFNKPSGDISASTTLSPFLLSDATTPVAFQQNNFKPGVYAPNLQFSPASTPQKKPLAITQDNLAIQVNGNTAFTSQTLQKPLRPPAPSAPPQFAPQAPSIFVEPPAVNPQPVSPPYQQQQSLPPSYQEQKQPISSQLQQQPLPPTYQQHQQPIPPPYEQQQALPPSYQEQQQPVPPPYQQQPVPPSYQQQPIPPASQQQQPPPPPYQHKPTTPPQFVDDQNQILSTQNDTIPLPVNTFARPPINNQPEFDKKYPSNMPKEPEHNRLDDVKVENGMIYVPNNPPIKIQDKYPGMVDGLPNGIEEKDIVDLLYRFNYTIGFHGHYEKGLRNGTKIGGYFVNGRDGISRVVTYVADEQGYRPKFKLVNLGLDSPFTPKEATEKTFGLKNFEFVWYPLK